MPEKRIWFPAKTYGWGWGPPCAWQGWVVLFIFLIILAGWFTIGANSPASLKPLLSVLTIPFLVLWVAALIAICWWKGETPRWRWGE